MKKFILFALVCFAAVSANSQNLITRIGRNAVSSARMRTEFGVASTVDQAVSKGINSVLSGKVFKKSSKGTDDTMISYINSQWGFKGQYPGSYTKQEDEDGTVSFTSKDGNINVIYYGTPAEVALAEEFAETKAGIANEYELLDSSSKANEYTLHYNMGGVFAFVRVLRNGDRQATVAVTYPEAEAKSYKKLMQNILNGLTFFK